MVKIVFKDIKMPRQKRKREKPKVLGRFAPWVTRFHEGAVKIIFDTIHPSQTAAVVHVFLCRVVRQSVRALLKLQVVVLEPK